jgi:hypothetical protein
MFAALKTLIPNFHAYSDDESRYNMGATWTSMDGLQDYHNVEFRYVRNSEALALQGDPQPDGSFRYTEPNGRVHTMAPERVSKFMEQTSKQATIMCDMLEKLRDYENGEKPVDTTVVPA